MAEKSLERLDLNLLMALHWLLTERSVTDAAIRLNLSQPATSRALARLRDFFEDPLLVKTGRAMVPTPKAERLQPAITIMIENLRDVLRVSEDFNPATETGRVRIAASDYIGVFAFKAWLDSVAKEAPALEFDIVELNYASARELISGRIDLVLMPDMNMVRNRTKLDLDQFVRKPLFEDEFISMVRIGHPLAGKKITLDQYLKHDHVLINPEGMATGIVDEVLEEKNLSRRIGFRTAGFLMALPTVMHTDCILTAPGTLARVMPESFYTFTPPVPLPRMQMFAAWHPNWTHDPRHRWIRERLFSELMRHERQRNGAERQAQNA